MLIAIAGKARVGKDTIGNYLEREYGFERAYFARPLKQMLEVGLDLKEENFQTTEQKEAELPQFGSRTYRHLAQTLGTEWGRNCVHPDLWVKITMQRWARLCEKAERMGFDPRMVLTDCRFNNEARAVREAGGVIVHVLGVGQFGMSEQAKAHESEAGVPHEEGDRILFNHFTEGEQGNLDSLRGLYAGLDALMNGLLESQRG